MPDSWLCYSRHSVFSETFHLSAWHIMVWMLWSFVQGGMIVFWSCMLYKTFEHKLAFFLWIFCNPHKVTHRRYAYTPINIWLNVPLQVSPWPNAFDQGETLYEYAVFWSRWIILTWYLTACLGRIGGVHLNWLVCWHRPGL